MKPKAPRWLTESFAVGIDEREAMAQLDEWTDAQCWLAQFDPTNRRCSGRYERFHYVSRQRVENALRALLPDVSVFSAYPGVDADLVLLAAWDPRNGGIACEAHHRRFDSHLVPLPSEQIVVPYDALPEHVIEFADDYGLEDELSQPRESSEAA